MVVGRARWKTVAQPADGVTWWSIERSTIYLLSHKAAPRFRVLAEPLAAPDFAKAETVLPERHGVITGMAAASDALYLAERNGGGMALLRLPYGAKSPETITTPFQGVIYPPTEDAGALAADPRAPGAVFEMESWVHPPVWFSYDPSRRQVTDMGIIPRPSRDFSAYETVETAVRAPDGVMVPLSIVFKRGLKRDGRHPTLLEGYGSFAVSMDPTFRPSILAWVDRGGVYAMAHVRGGGRARRALARGRHADAQGHLDHRSYIACAEALIAGGYTSKAWLAGEGTSGGGLLVGAAMVRRPDLFGAILLRVPAIDPLRFDQLKVGTALAPEYGSVKDPDQARTLVRTDAYAQVADGVAYPAVLLTAGLNDPRVLPWMPAKMAARLRAASASGQPVLLRVEFEAGHGAGATASQQTTERADEFAFLLWRLGGTPGGD